MHKSPLKSEILRAEAVSYIKRWIGTPYIWSGEDFGGFDCSGLISEDLQSVGRLRHRERLSVKGLYRKFQNGKHVLIPYAGCLVFWFDGDRPYHVGMLINNLQVVDSSGGGEETKTIEDAIEQDAFVKVRPLYYRGSNFKIIDPFKDWDPDEDSK